MLRVLLNLWIDANNMARKSKYGYARDIFGRVQERDLYKEEKHEKPKYDYSSYDREDDHDNVYYNEMYD